MKSIYIILSDTGSLFNKALKTVTLAPYNHASLALDDNLRSIYSFGRREPSNPFWGGFVKEDFVQGTFSWFPEATCAIYELRVTQREYQRLERIIKAFEHKYKHYLYNYIGLLGIPVNQPLQLPATYFCSQFVAEVLHRAGRSLFKKASSLVTPDDFRQCADLTLVYQGRLYDYPKLYSRSFYQPWRYRSFPMRKYIKQQFKGEILGMPESDHKHYYFRDGFIKPKKVFLTRKLHKLTRAVLRK
ncbi:hypothetical protein [Thalassobacillus sp. CUG 92003]|uniref:hypothetical protein n=1 Tax=Thalassobacillus sp. CUG 92003 TaxID=2736641 RepID=UPI00351A28A0